MVSRLSADLGKKATERHDIQHELTLTIFVLPQNYAVISRTTLNFSTSVTNAAFYGTHLFVPFARTVVLIKG